MSDGRQKAEWTRGASHTASLMGATSGAAVDPAELVPPRFRPGAGARRKTTIDEATESELAWRLLGAGLRAGG